MDSIEVQDNGTGITPENYESVALKHYTSKLSTYDDLDTLETFGFRGEALSSLCALSKFTVTTCLASDVPKGTKLEYEPSGKLKGKSVVATQKGTTVTVEKLFHNLPVRRRELERNIKREWGKVIGLLNQYACIQTSTKFSVSQQPTKGKRIVLFSTKGNQNTRENLINVFGAKTLSCLIPLDLKLEIEPTKVSYLKLQPTGNSSKTEVRVVGHVSRPSPGEGRNTPDRQMFYVNGRPCGLPQFAKVFNETYKSYAPNQSPFIFTNIKLDTHLYDVNVSPDKRTVLLHDQGKMLDSLRDALFDLFESQRQTVPISQPTVSRRLAPFKKPGVSTGNNQVSDPTPKPFSLISPSSSVDHQSGKTQSGHSSEEENPISSIRRFTAGIVSSSSTSGRGSCLTSLRGVVEEPDLSIAHISSKPVEEHGLRKENLSNDAKVHKSALPILKDTEFVQTPQRVKDFHSVTGQMQSSTGSLARPELGEEENSVAPFPPPAELSIPSISPKARPMAAPPSGIGYTISRAPKRPTQEEVASITIGNTTVTTMIGSQAKRPKVGDAGGSATQPAVTGKANRRSRARPASSVSPLPSFGGRLGQMFAAAAARQVNMVALRATRDSSEELEDGEDDIGEHAEGTSSRQGDDTEVDEEESVREKHLLEKEDEESDEDALFVSDRPRRRLSSSQVDQISSDAMNLGPSSPGKKGEKARAQRLSSETQDDDEDHHDLAIEHDDDEYDSAGFLPEDEKRQVEDAKVSALIARAEAKKAADSELANKRAAGLVKPLGRGRSREATLGLTCRVKTEEEEIIDAMGILDVMDPYIAPCRPRHRHCDDESDDVSVTDTGVEGIDADVRDAEQKLESLIVEKSDFEKLKVIGQFNLGFIITLRKGRRQKPRSPSSPSSSPPANSSNSSTSIEGEEDDLFIIDQHASDEKFNFERLQATTTVTSQRLVTPKQLELTALEEEIILNNIPALEANGFGVHVDASGDVVVGRRVELLSLPTSREVTFGMDDFEELVALLGERVGDHHDDGRSDDGDHHHHNHSQQDANSKSSSCKTHHQQGDFSRIPRPSKVRKMFAMRACRSSVMIGRALTKPQMTRLVRQMAGLDKPWNCPHGRPTMRHLTNLGSVGLLADWNHHYEDYAREEDVAIVEWERYLRRMGRL